MGIFIFALLPSWNVTAPREPDLSAFQWNILDLSPTQQSPLQQRLHVTPAIGNQQNVNVLIHDTVNDAVGFEEDLTVFTNPESQQLFRIASPLREFGQLGDGSLDLVQNIVGFLRRIVQSRVVVKLVEIPRCVIGQENRKWHH
jgi:hypothetical protein